MAKETVKNKKKKTNSLSKKIGRGVVMVLMIGGIVYFLTQINKEVKTTFSLLANLKESEKILEELEQEKEHLQNQKEKLSDENYISSVARGKYLISSSSEQIYVLPPLDD